MIAVMLLALLFPATAHAADDMSAKADAQIEQVKRDQKAHADQLRAEQQARDAATAARSGQ